MSNDRQREHMAADPPASAARDALLDTAADVARRLRAFDAYGSQARAERALRRRCPGFTDVDYTRALASAVELFDAAYSIATEHAAELQSIPHPTAADLEPYVRRLAPRHPAFPEATRRWLASWVIYYFALR